MQNQDSELFCRHHNITVADNLMKLAQISLKANLEHLDLASKNFAGYLHKFFTAMWIFDAENSLLLMWDANAGLRQT